MIVIREAYREACTRKNKNPLSHLRRVTDEIQKKYYFLFAISLKRVYIVKT